MEGERGGWYCCWHTMQKSHYSLFSFDQSDLFLTRLQDVNHSVLLNDVGWQFEGWSEKFTTSRGKYDLYCLQLSIIKSQRRLWFSSFKPEDHKVVQHQTRYYYYWKEQIPSKVDLQIMIVNIRDNFNPFKVFTVCTKRPAADLLIHIIFWVLIKQEW